MPNAARRTSAALVAAALLVSAPAFAQVLYKWIDADGKTQYSDQPPKKAAGEVTRIEPDAQPTPAPPPKAAPAATPQPAAKPAPASQDLASKRRATRAVLEKRLVAARDNLERAKKALADASPEPEERQVVQQQIKAGQGGMHGQSTARSNCRQVRDKNGKAALICPTILPKEEYFDRVAKLEDAVRVAEEQLAEAEQAWRRGVD